MLSICILIPVKCLNCKAVSDTYEPFLDVTLDIKVRCLVSMGWDVWRPVELHKIKSFCLKTYLVETKELGGGCGWIGLCYSVEAMEMLSVFGLGLAGKIIIMSTQTMIQSYFSVILLQYTSIVRLMGLIVLITDAKAYHRYCLALQNLFILK